MTLALKGAGPATMLTGGFANLILGAETNGWAIDAVTGVANLVVRDTTTGGNVFDGLPESKLSVARAGATATMFDAAGLLTTPAINTLRYDRVPGTGVLRGILVEPARTNLCLWNQDLTNAAWTKTNITAAKDQTGLTGAANSASKITASAANGTCLQAITSTSSARTVSAWVKRVTGSGTIQMTCDNGSTWTAITVTSSWARQSIPLQTLANPTVGFRIVTSGDAIAVDGVQCESASAGDCPTMPLMTTTTSVTRNVDVITFPMASFPFSASEGSIKVNGSMVFNGSNENYFSVTDGGGTHFLRCRNSNSGAVTFNVTSAGTGQANVIPSPTVTTGVTFDVGCGWKVNEVDAHVNGTLGTQDVVATMPTGMNTFYIGVSEVIAQPGLFTLRKMLYLPRKMTTVELVTLL